MKLEEIIESLKSRKGISLDLSISCRDGKLCGSFHTSLNFFKELAKGRAEQVEFERKPYTDYPYELRLIEEIEDFGCELEIKALVGREAMGCQESEI